MVETRRLLALMILMLCTTVAQAQIGIAAKNLGDDGDGPSQLYSVNLATGAQTLLGPTGYGDVEGLSFHPFTGELFAVDEDSSSLLTCSPVTGACTTVGSLGVAVGNPGLAFTYDGTLYLASDDQGDVVMALYSVNTATGTATLVGPYGPDFRGNSLAYSPIATGCSSRMWILNADPDTPVLGCVSLSTGAVTTIGPVGTEMDGQPAIEFDASGTLWVVEESQLSDALIGTLNSETAELTAAPYTLDGGGMEALAIPDVCGGVSIPTTGSRGLVLLALLVAGAAILILRRIS